jgi:predicted DNA-binding protein
MQQDYQSILPLCKEDIKIKLPIEQSIKLYSQASKLGMTKSQYIIYLMEEYDGDSINTIINFRYNLNRRIKKGINRIYINQLIKLQTQLNILLEKL